VFTDCPGSGENSTENKRSFSVKMRLSCASASTAPFSGITEMLVPPLLATYSESRKRPSASPHGSDPTRTGAE